VEWRAEEGIGDVLMELGLEEMGWGGVGDGYMVVFLEMGHAGSCCDGWWFFFIYFPGGEDETGRLTLILTFIFFRGRALGGEGRCTVRC